METGEFSHPRRTVGAKGRIAQVLAQARATLKEPSRPITPASLDARTSLDLNFTGNGRDRSKLSPYHGLLAENLKFTPSSSSIHANPLSKSLEQSLYSNQTSTSNVQSLHLLLCDFGDIISCLEGASLESNGQSLRQLLLNLSQPIDRLSKKMKSGEVTAPKAFSSIEKTLHDLSRAVSRIINDIKYGDLRHISCRHLLRLCMSFVAIQTNVSSTASVMTIILTTTKAMFNIRQRDEQMDENSDANSQQSDQNDAMLQGGIDLLLDYLKMVWTRLPGDIAATMKTFADQEAIKENTHYDAYGDDDVEGAGEGGGGSEVALECVVAMLEAATYSAGVLRSYSNGEVNRRRLIHLAVVERMAESLRAAGTAAVNAQPAKSLAKSDSFSAGLGRTLMLSVSPSLNESKRAEETIKEKLGHVLVQVVATLRNFSLDPVGRSQMQAAEVVGVLCRLMRVFSASPELVLNCARVTAKLSLLEPFRSQINRKPVHIKCLVDVIVREATMCQEVMDDPGDGDAMGGGRGSEEDEEDEEVGSGRPQWPSWHTWPLLSRISFTLGNLTTTNDVNRTLIGVECKCLKPLIVLLQACACSLTALCAAGSGSADADDGEGDEGSDCEEEEDAAGAGAGAGEQELWDATVKLLRLMANLCIDDSIGSAVGRRPEAIQMLIELLACASGGSKPEQEELLLNVVAACTNVTFYACQRNGTDSGSSSRGDNQAPPSRGESRSKAQRDKEVRASKDGRAQDKIERSLVSLALHLSHCLFHDNEEVVLETSRALGNLTRSPGVLKALRTSRTDEALVLLLNHANRDVAAAVTGALVNLSADPGGRTALIRSANPAPALVTLLRKASLKDLPMAELVCQAFHNFLLEDEGQRELLSDASLAAGASHWTETLADTLEELIDCAEEFHAAASAAKREARARAEHEAEASRGAGNPSAGKSSSGRDVVADSEEGDDSFEGSKYATFVHVGKLVLKIVVDHLTGGGDDR